MKSFLPPSPYPRTMRRLKPATVARRCVGSLILLAGTVIVTTDLVAMLRGGDAVAESSAVAKAPIDRLLPAAR